MIPEFGDDGKLPAGIHWATWDELHARFGTTEHRRRLLSGLIRAFQSLKAAGCRAAYVDGSFVTEKTEPQDFDVCWEPNGVDPSLLDPVLLTFASKRAAQKAKYGGELFPASFAATASGQVFLEFLQVDKDTGDPKGIVAIDLRRLT